MKIDPLNKWSPSQEITLNPSTQNELKKPDIYYIIVDGYAREDVLKSIYNFDNSDFLMYLNQQGFYIPSKSQSNYIQSALSLASSLNFGYFNHSSLAENNSYNRKPLQEMIINSNVRSILEKFGYHLIYIYSGYAFTDIPDADIYLSVKKSRFTHLEGAFIDSTGLKTITNSLGVEEYIPGYELHRQIILNNFDQLSNIPDKYNSKPKFVFAHIVLPHPPFIFDREGNAITPARPYTINDGNYYRGSEREYVNDYVEQLIFTNEKLRDTINQILNKSKMPPIIILQADHGPGAYLDWDSAENSCLMERFSILNAYFLPGNPDTNLYPTISPVNSFRVILDTYFNSNLGLLEDRQYYSPWLHPYQFVDVTDISNQNCSIDQ
jgi:hypothetical protein